MSDSTLIVFCFVSLICGIWIGLILNKGEDSE